MEESTITSTAIPSDDEDLLTEDIFHQNNDPTTADGEIENGEQAGENGISSEEPQVKIRKKLNIPRLNEERLCSRHGIPSLQSVFSKVKFKGPGHEASNLKILLRQYEYWGNQLFPKYCFEDFVEKVETLGFKSSVKVCVNKLRRGEEIFPEENENFENNQPNAEEDDSTEQFGFGAIGFGDQDDIAPAPIIAAITQDTSITNELRQKIEKNKKIALERRAAREALALQQNQNNELNNSQINDITQNDDSDINPSIELIKSLQVPEGSDHEMAIDEANCVTDTCSNGSKINNANDESDDGVADQSNDLTFDCDTDPVSNGQHIESNNKGSLLEPERDISSGDDDNMLSTPFNSKQIVESNKKSSLQDDKDLDESDDDRLSTPFNSKQIVESNKKSSVHDDKDLDESDDDMLLTPFNPKQTVESSKETSVEIIEDLDESDNNILSNPFKKQVNPTAPSDISANNKTNESSIIAIIPTTTSNSNNVNTASVNPFTSETNTLDKHAEFKDKSNIASLESNQSTKEINNVDDNDDLLLIPLNSKSISSVTSNDHPDIQKKNLEEVNKITTESNNDNNKILVRQMEVKEDIILQEKNVESNKIMQDKEETNKIQQTVNEL